MNTRRPSDARPDGKSNHDDQMLWRALASSTNKEGSQLADYFKVPPYVNNYQESIVNKLMQLYGSKSHPVAEQINCLLKKLHEFLSITAHTFDVSQADANSINIELIRQQLNELGDCVVKTRKNMLDVSLSNNQREIYQSAEQYYFHAIESRLNELRKESHPISQCYDAGTNNLKPLLDSANHTSKTRQGPGL